MLKLVLYVILDTITMLDNVDKCVDMCLQVSIVKYNMQYAYNIRI